MTKSEALNRASKALSTAESQHDANLAHALIAAANTWVAIADRCDRWAGYDHREGTE